ncbi:MAG: hypothetical protein JSU96_12640 [Acidobacteriota bacterium]|nr:MAG: hypothetical protein JSU96_12640 [Acidobacteriota bacterium]
MQYQVRVAGKIFEGTDIRTLLKRAVEAKRKSLESRLPAERLIGAGFRDTLTSGSSL